MFEKDDQPTGRAGRPHPTSLADRRADASRDAIVDAAWALSRTTGLTGWSLRELATTVGLKAPTLYAYVESKHGIYDLMFRRGWVDFDRRLGEADRRLGEADRLGGSAPDHRSAFKHVMHEFMAFCVEDPTRYQLMFQRVVPDFVPTPDAYTASVEAYARFRTQMAHLGVTDDAHLDLWTAISTGLVDQQLANDPGGDRWVRLVDDAVDMFLDHVERAER